MKQPGAAGITIDSEVKCLMLLSLLPPAHPPPSPHKYVHTPVQNLYVELKTKQHKHYMLSSCFFAPEVAVNR